MASHLSDIGFTINKETFYDDLISIFETHMKSSDEISAGEKSYLVIYVDNDIEFWLPIGENKTVDPYSFELHYNTHRWENIINPEWISKSEDEMQGLVYLWQADEEFPMNVNIPNALMTPVLLENHPYKAQMACFVEHIEVFGNSEDFRKKHKDFAEMSFFPTGSFDLSDDEEFTQSATAWINGIVESVNYKKNSYTQKDYLHILVKCYNMKFDLLVDANEVSEIKIGDIVSANVWISAKIGEVD